MPFVDLARNKSQNASQNTNDNMNNSNSGMPQATQSVPSPTPPQATAGMGASSVGVNDTDAQSQVVNPPTTDPVSIEDGLVDEAVQAPDLGQNVQRAKMDDGSTVISKPQASELGKDPLEGNMDDKSNTKDESSTLYPTLESMKQDVSSVSNSSSDETQEGVSPESVPQAQTSSDETPVATTNEKDNTLANMGTKSDVSNSPLVLGDTGESLPESGNSSLESETKSTEVPDLGQKVTPPPADIPPVSKSNIPIPSLEDQQESIQSKPQTTPGLGDLPPLKKTQEETVNQTVESTPQTTKIESNVLDPDTATLKEYISYCLSKEASDIHFAVNYPVHLRVDGRLEKVGQKVMTEENAERLLLPILTEEQRTKLEEEEIEADFMHVDEDKNRFRVNVFKEKGDLSGAFRWIPKRVRTIDELNLPPILKEFSKVPYGLVLVTGPTGSGKTTTIAAMIEEINKTEPRHVITIEDPVEYVFDQKVALIAQRNMTQDTASWKNALRSVLRQDPDVVLIGEMRDYETIASALTIAETGHLVFATLHTNTAAQSIDRIIDVFPEGQQNQVRSQLSMMLSGVISQRLIPLGNGGRKAAMEILIGTPAVKNAIREGKTHQIDNIIQTSADVGMVGLEKSLVEMIRSGEIDVETAKDFTIKPDEIDLLLR